MRAVKEESWLRNPKCLQGRVRRRPLQRGQTLCAQQRASHITSAQPLHDHHLSCLDVFGMQKRQRCQHTLRSHTQCTSDLQPSTALVCGVTPPDVVFVFIKMAKPALQVESPGDVSGSYFSFICKSKTLHFYYHWGIKPKLQIYNSYFII